MVVVRGDHGSTPQLGLRISGAVLLAVSAGIHLDLYLTGYRKIPTIGWLFLLQVIVGFMLTIAALVTRSRLAAAASAALALSTLGAYLLAVWIGLFGFKEIRTRAGLAAGLIEVAAFATLALAAVTADSARRAAVPAVPAVPAASGGAFARRVHWHVGRHRRRRVCRRACRHRCLCRCWPRPGAGPGRRAPCRWWSPRSAPSRWPPWPCSASR